MNLLKYQSSEILAADGERADLGIVLKNGESAATSRHPFLESPTEWLTENREEWQSCFRDRPGSELVIGCADPRMDDLCDLRWPGLGMHEADFEKAAQKIMDLQRHVYRNCQIVLLTHGGCKAAQRALDDHGVGDKDADEFSMLWGGNLAKFIDRETGNTGNIRHEHIRKMRPEQGDMSVIYVDCTDRFRASNSLPCGPTISLQNPKGIGFRTEVFLRNILGNGLESHLLPDINFMVEALSGGESTKDRFSEKKPLTIALIRSKKESVLSNIAQRGVEELAERHYGRIKIVPLDERGTHYEPLTTKTPVGCP